jgi:hypothetical protein
MTTPFREKLTLQAVSLVEEGDATFDREIASFRMVEKANNKSPLSNPTRSLAFIKFVLCHSLPTINENGACWTYATLKNSSNTVVNQLVDINHMIRDNMSIMEGMENDQHDMIIGHMISGEIGESPDDGLVPSSAMPIVVTAVLYKRAAGVQGIIDRLKKGDPVKVSMECEYDDMGYFYEGKLIAREDHPELAAAHKANKKTVAGKPYARVIGGVRTEGGIVNFHGAAILVGDAPADPNANVLEAVACRDAIMEVGGELSSIQSVDAGVEKAAFGEGDAPLTPTTFDGQVEDITLENLQAGQMRQMKAIDNIEKTLETILDGWEKVAARFTNSSRTENPDENDRVEDVSEPGVPGQPLTEGDRYKDITAPDAGLDNSDVSPKIDPNTEFADPGYGDKGEPEWPLNSREEVLAAADFFSTWENVTAYTPAQLSIIQEKILRAAVKFRLSVPSILIASMLGFRSEGEAATAEHRRNDKAQEVTSMTEEEKKAAEAAAAKAATDAAAKAEADAAAAAEAAAAEEEAKGKVPPQFQKKDDKKSDKKDDSDDEDDEDDKPDFLKKKKAKASDEETEEGSSLRQRLEELTRQNELLAAQVNKMQESEAARQKSERAANRKKSFAAKVELDDELAAELENHFNDADDEEFASFESLAEKLYTRGLKKALESAGAGALASDAAKSPASDGAATEDDKSKEEAKSETAARKPFAPIRAESGDGSGATTNPYLSL